MARFSISGRTTIIGTAVLPNVSLYATAAVRPKVREVGLFNTAATAVCVGLYRLTAAGTQGAGLTEVPEDNPALTAIATGFAGHTAGTPIGAEVRRATLGAAAGSGIIWTFTEGGLVVPNTTGDGVGIAVPTGTGQTLDYYIVWEE